MIQWGEFDTALRRALQPYVVPGVNPEHALARRMAAKVANPLEMLLIALHGPMTQEATRLGRPFIPSQVVRPPT
jgi:hypothetical protein